MAIRYYIWADDGSIFPEPDIRDFSAWLEHARLVVADTQVGFSGQHVRIQTRFTALAANPDVEPMLWETRVYCPEDPSRTNLALERAWTLEAAAAQHRRIVDGWMWWFSHTLGRVATIDEDVSEVHPAAANLTPPRQGA